MAILIRNPFNRNLDLKYLSSQNISFDVSKNEGFIKLIVGLGNVGKKYHGTRHNIGFDILEEYAHQNGFPEFKENKKFFGELSEKFIAGKKVILLKPSTMMNLSGKSVRTVADFYKIPPQSILIIHDELDLNYGTVKLKEGGAGKSTHNGLRDISKQLATNDFSRLRIGIKNDLLEKMDATDFVLGKFSRDEQANLPKIITEALNLI